MTSRLHLLLAAACALALIQLASGQSKCDLQEVGSKTANTYEYKPVELTPGQTDWKVAIPPPPPHQCAKVVGTKGLSCDYDVAPSSFFMGSSALMIKRLGETKQTAIVYITAYCL
ncbi:uncharacterized protein LOC142985198 [Anticarsia gemmatalis]|uniref:uncharacterized protein LOC142985198 n=1 Tax=Anticarsia gemmatalis TaxID=129554 RepID=UPI003F76C6AD